jgi:hypothetical protein
MRLTQVHERILISLISLHSFIVGTMLMFFAEWAVRFAGWSGAEPIFFIWQAGAFHFVLLAIENHHSVAHCEDDRVRISDRCFAARGYPLVGVVLRRRRRSNGPHRLPRA